MFAALGASRSRLQPDPLGYSKSTMELLPRLRRSLTRAPWRRSRRSLLASAGAMIAGSAMVIAVAGWHLSATRPGPESPDGAGPVASPGAGQPAKLTAARSPLSGIILPDLLIVLPK